MGRSGCRVFIDAVIWREVARDEVDAVSAGRSRDRVCPRDPAQRRKVGPQSRHILDAVVDRYSAAARDKAFGWRPAQRRK